MHILYPSVWHAPVLTIVITQITPSYKLTLPTVSGLYAKHSHFTLVKNVITFNKGWFIIYGMGGHTTRKSLYLSQMTWF